MGEGSKRIYVGNLYPGVTSDELKEKFNRFGSVDSAEVKHKTDIDGNPVQTFAFVNLHVSDSDLSKCISSLSNTKWKGYEMRVQQAKESFMSRLQKERSTREREDRSVGRDKTNTSWSYNPLAIFKDKLAAEGGTEKTDQGEKKIVAKHLGGDKNDPSRKIKKSGNFQKLGKSEAKNGADREMRDNGEIQETETKDQEDDYNPLAMIKNKSAESNGEKPRKRKVDEGTVSDGIISFSDHSSKKSGKKRKVREYHSSDEDETPVSQLPVNHEQTSKTKKEDKENKRKNKEEKKKKRKTSESSPTRKESAPPREKEANSEEVDEELDIEEEKKRNYEILSQVMGKEVKQVKKKTPKQPQNFMPRFDPSVNQADDAEFSAANYTPDVKSSKKHDSILNLKAAFGSSDKSGGGNNQPFSFGFLGSTTEDEKSTGTTAEKTGQLFTLDDEERTQGKGKGEEFSNKFGNQLIGKSAGPAESFFFSNCEESDTRIKDGIKFFFEDRPDLQAIRDGYQKKRADLKDIFRKRARSKAQLLRKNVKSKQNNTTIAKKKRRRQKKKT